MRIRSITVFTSPERISDAGRLAASAKAALTGVGYEVQTTRLALPPIELWLRNDLTKTGREIESAATSAAIDYVSIGAVPESREFLNQLPELIAQTQSVFACAHIADNAGRVFSASAPAIARAIKQIANATPEGFGNLRFAAMANCAPGTPFFPASYCKPDDFSFALAIECADLALDAAQRGGTANECGEILQRHIESNAAEIEPVLDAVARAHSVRFTGCDWSLAPHPDVERSIGAAIEKLSGATLGNWGTLSAVAILTRAIKRANARKVGFCGVFLPVLEDAILAKRGGERAYDLQHLLLYSSVCGAGLDTIPLPGDVSESAIAALLIDVATLASVLNKPLTVRLMPVPGLSEGEATRFNFPYLINTRTLSLSGSAPGLLRDEILNLKL